MPKALQPPLVLADADLLVKDVESATLFDLNKAGLIALHWTPEIEAEYIEHRARLRAEKNSMPTASAEDILWAGARIETNKKFLVPNAMIVGWELESTLETMEMDAKFAGLKSIPDPDDVHVAMAAAFLADSSKRPVILATHNLADLPQKKLSPFNVSVLHPGDILDALYQKSPKQVAASLLNTCQGFKNPPFTESDFLRSVSGSNQFNNPALAKLIKAAWNNAKSKGKQRDHGLTP